MAKPIGILGGTFDPVHFGHLRLALEVHQRLGLEHVCMVPLHTPNHRDAPRAGPEHRLQMLTIATAGVPELIVDPGEIRRGGISYTVDTLRTLRQAFAEQSLCLIMGADAFAGLNRWHAWQTIPEYAHIIVVTRPGSDTPSLHPDITALLQARETQDQQEIHRHSGGLIMRIDAPLLEISSSRIRAAISSRQNVSFLLPQDVITYIHAQSLYQAAG